MNERSLSRKLSGIPIGGMRYFDTLGSTNDEALVWATAGAVDLSLVVADEQTAGRGRLKRTWYTPPGSALAFSLILHPAGVTHLSRMAGLAALAIADACSALGLDAALKWPNDVLLGGKKVAGILIEAVWSGAQVDSLVVGMGVNVRRESVPPADRLQFPATSIEEQLGRPPSRESLLAAILKAFLVRRPTIDGAGFLHAWEDRLAFRGQAVQVHAGAEEPLEGELDGLDPDGSLRLRSPQGGVVVVRAGDLSLRPAS